jgi:hypothetical protein
LAEKQRQREERAAAAAALKAVKTAAVAAAAAAGPSGRAAAMQVGDPVSGFMRLSPPRVSHCVVSVTPDT